MNCLTTRLKWTARGMATWTKHLDKNSQCPPLDPDKVTFFNMRYCPYAQRTALVLEAKGIPYDTININLISKPQWFLDKNPLGKVPTIQVGKEIYYESLPVCDYLDAAFPGPKLSPDSLREKTRNSMLIAHMDNVIGGFYRLLLSSDLEARPRHKKNLLKNAAVLNQSLEGKQYFGGGKRPGMLDYMIWPWFERLPVLPLLRQDIEDDILASLSLLTSWSELMRQDEAVNSYVLDTEAHLAFMTSFISRSPIYDPPAISQL